MLTQEEIHIRALEAENEARECVMEIGRSISASNDVMDIFRKFNPTCTCRDCKNNDTCDAAFRNDNMDGECARNNYIKL